MKFIPWAGVLTLFLTSACEVPWRSASKLHSDDATTLRTALSTAVTNFYLKDSLQKNVWNFNTLFAQTLFVRDDQSNLVGDLAVSFRIAGPNFIQIQTRHGATFHDGRAVECKDIAWSFQDSSHAGSPYVSTFANIESWNCAGTTFEIKLKKPIYGLIEKLVCGIRIYPENSYPAHSMSPIGSGPYKLVSTTPTKSVWKRHSAYVGAFKPIMDNIVIHYIPDSRAQFEWLKSGKLDLLLEWPADMEPILEKQKGSFQVFTYPASNLSVIGLSMKSKCFGKLSARQALANFVAQNKTLLGGFVGSKLFTLPVFSPSIAKLQCPGTQLSLSAQSNVSHLATPLLQKLQTATEVSSLVQESSVFYSKLNAGAYDAFVVSLPAEDDAVSLYEWLHSSQLPPQKNRFFYKNAQVDQSLEKLTLTAEPKERANLLQIIASHVNHDIPFVPLGQLETKLVSQKNIILKKSISNHPWLMMIEAVKKKP